MRNTKKGNITVEAAIVLPMFIIAVVSIGFFINYAAERDSVFHCMTDEAQDIAGYAYVVKAPVGIKGRIESRVMDESSLLDRYNINSMTYMINDGRISVKSTGEILNTMPVKMHDGIKFDCDILFRGFVPEDNAGELFTFDMMEMSADGGIVWVFPVAGERYHEKDCPYIAVDARQVILSDEILKEFKPCDLCGAKNLPKGSIVYCFFNTGEVYHDGSCTSVDRYVVSMSRLEAEMKGYTPCSKCGGGI